MLLSGRPATLTLATPWLATLATPWLATLTVNARSSRSRARVDRAFDAARRPPRMFDEQERRYLEAARLGRLATADAEGRPHVVPVCFAFVGDDLATPIDEKPKAVGPDDLRRSRDVRENPRVAVVVDHYAEDWSGLGWVQVRGTATHVDPGDGDPDDGNPDGFHADAVAALRAKYDQYATHALEERPVIRIEPGSVRSWGRLERPGGA